MSFHNFYDDLEELKKYSPDADFGFLENISDGNYNAYNFLHGYCHIFAYALSKEKGYSILMKKEEKQPDFIHVWCINMDEMIDIRGKTTNLSAFWSEFDEYGSYDNPHISTAFFKDAEDLYDYLGKSYFDNNKMDFAKSLITDYYDFY